MQEVSEIVQKKKLSLIIFNPDPSAWLRIAPGVFEIGREPTSENHLTLTVNCMSRGRLRASALVLFP